MTEKVLGFEEKDANLKWKTGIKNPPKSIAGYYIPKNNLVPVVTIEWLEKYCLENGTVCISCGAVTCAICQKDLLKAVRLQVEEKE